jgi:hypothetical protein
MNSLLSYPTFWEYTRACSTLVYFPSPKDGAATMMVPTLVSFVLYFPCLMCGHDSFKLKRRNDMDKIHCRSFDGTTGIT